MGDPISAERVAEVMWHRGNMDPAVKAHLTWLAVPDDEKQLWFDRATAAIADWCNVQRPPSRTGAS
jgi:hypothetical protein